MSGDSATTASPLGDRLAARIARLGPMTLADYMAEVLTHPEQGYYMRRDPFGARGDFITAPEISQMFGELIGLWCVETWRRMGARAPVLLVELGPGRGTLMADALRAARLDPDFIAALELHLVEVSPALRRRQRDALADTVSPTWHESLAGVPEGPMLLIANEFFDALPVRQFEKRGRGWCERLVGLAEDGHSLAFALAPPGPQGTALLPPELAEAPDGAIAEVSPASITIAHEIGRRVAAEGGAALVIDYGHARPRTGATLQAVRAHGFHPVLADPGSADLTAHVDFAALARAAEQAGARAQGPVTQGRFLEALGIGARAAALAEAGTTEQASGIEADQRRLTHPDEMGTLFKVLALGHPGLGPLAGFE
ncbi:MAG: SAM-dependent methyltransferase [Kiloniellales bacterium]